MEILEYSFISGSLPHTLMKADISIILKKGKNLEDCTGYTPIVLVIDLLPLRS